MVKEYYLYVNGQRVKVSEQIYKVYWREKEHEKYLEQVDRKNHLLFFSSLDHDGHFIDNIADEIVDVEKIVETRILIETVRKAISKLNDQTVALLSKLDIDKHISVEIELDEMDLTSAESKATYAQINATQSSIWIQEEPKELTQEELDELEKLRKNREKKREYNYRYLKKKKPVWKKL